jgi:hypothetical protein
VYKQNNLTAKQYKANVMEEQAEATEELIANLTESHTCQMEIIIKSKTEAMKEMIALVKSENRSPTNNMKRQKRKKGRKGTKNKKKITMYQLIIIATKGVD